VAASGAGRGAGSRAEAWAFAALVAGAAALRWIAWARTAAVFDDGPRFLAIARAIDAGWWSAALRDAFHPLYPLLTAATHAVLRRPDAAAGWEAAGALVSVLGGAAAVGFLFLFLRDAFGRGPAWCGALLLAVHSRAIEYASDVQSDGLYLALFAAGLWAGWRAWRERAPGWAAFAGAMAGLAYLTRPEGLGLALVLGALGTLSIAAQRWPWRAGARWLAALALATGVCMAPYVAALHALTGTWTLTNKKSVTAMARAEVERTPGAPAPASPAPAATPAPPVAAPGAEPPPGATAAAPATPRPAPPGGPSEPAPPPWLDALGLSAPVAVDASWMTRDYLEQDGLRVALAASPAARAAEAVRMLVRHGKSALRYGVVVLAALGLAAAWGRPGARGLYVAAIVGAYVVVLYALTASAGYVSRRHALPPLLPLFGYAGLGALAAGAWLGRAAGAPRRAALTGALVLAGFMAGELFLQRAPKRLDELALRRGAEWLRAHAPGPGRLAAPRQRLGYYAELPFVPLGGIADEALDRYLSLAGVRYVLLDERESVEALRRAGAEPGAGGGGVRVLHHVEAAGREAWVLEIGRRPAPER
jgi:hypothetical protein